MKIGFYIKWPKNMFFSKGWNVIGDELYANSMCKYLKKFKEVDSADLYAPNFLPEDKLDVMIYLNDSEPNEQFAKKHILYLQNGYPEGSDVIIKKLYNFNYDGYMFISKKLLELHTKLGLEGIYLPFGVDLDLFYPREIDEKFNFEVAYIGNDIKGEYRTKKYILPATQFKFGLFGNWQLPKKKLSERMKFWVKDYTPEYKKILSKKSLGKILQENVPVLYSSSKININCSLQDCANWDIISLRIFEVLACKGFLITDRIKIVEEEMSDCVVFTDGDLDLIEKIRFYLEEEDIRKKFAENGYKYVVKHASIQDRMKELIIYLGEIL